MFENEKLSTALRNSGSVFLSNKQEKNNPPPFLGKVKCTDLVYKLPSRLRGGKTAKSAAGLVFPGSRLCPPRGEKNITVMRPLFFFVFFLSYISVVIQFFSWHKFLVPRLEPSVSPFSVVVCG